MKLKIFVLAAVLSVTLAQTWLSDGHAGAIFHSFDEQERLALHKELQRKITARVPVVMIFHRNNIILANERVANFGSPGGTWQIFKGLEEAYVR